MVRAQGQKEFGKAKQTQRGKSFNKVLYPCYGFVFWKQDRGALGGDGRNGAIGIEIEIDDGVSDVAEYESCNEEDEESKEDLRS